MREHLGFLRTSSVVVKIAAWIFLFIGIAGMANGLLILFSNQSSAYPLLMLFFSSAIYIFFFFFFYIIAKIAELLVKIINEIHKEPSKA